MSRKQILNDFLIIVLLLIFTMIYLLNTVNDNNEIKYNGYIVITYYLIGGISIINIIKDKSKYSLNKTFWFFNFFFFFLAPISQYLSGFYPWNFYIEEKYFFDANLCILLWLFVYSFTYSIVKTPKISLKTRLKDLNISTKFLIYLSIVALLILIALIGFKNLLSRETNVLDIDDTMIQSLIDKTLRSIPATSTIAYILITRKQNKKINLLFLSILLIAKIITVYPTRVTRYFMGTIYIGIALVMFDRLVKYRNFDLGLIAVFAILFPMFQIFKWYDFTDIFSMGLNFEIFNRSI